MEFCFTGLISCSAVHLENQCMTNSHLILTEFTKSHLIQYVLYSINEDSVAMLIFMLLSRHFRLAIWIATDQGGACFSPFQI
jgi:hypothetical protein